MGKLGAVTVRLGILGYGVQGRRMVARLAEHDCVRAIAAWDPSRQGLDAARAGGLEVAASAAELVRVPGIDCVYIASPPDSHLAHADLAFDAGLPVFCEKPLAVDFDHARRTIERIERDGLRAAVNFSLASSAGLEALGRAVADESLGCLREIHIAAAFKAWPRPWQAGAGRWLAERREGGFTREVLSHFVFVLQRVLGPARVLQSAVTYPGDTAASEASVCAQLVAGGVPVRVEGRVGGEAADFNRFALVRERGMVEFNEWLSSRRGDGPVTPQSPEARPAYLRQLDQLVALVEGRPHSLPGFAEALAVQETIEAILAGAQR